MKNINKYIIVVINRKYFGFNGGCCFVSILFEVDGVMGKGDVSMMSKKPFG